MKKKDKPSRINEDRQFASFDDDDETLTELLDRMGLLKYIEAIKDPEEQARVKDEIIKNLKPVLEKINVLPINRPQAKTQIKFKNRHFNLRKLVFTTLEVAGATLVIILLPPAAPLTAAALAVALTPTAISVVSKLDEIVHTLTPEELAVYNAIAGVILEKQNKALNEKRGASEEEIKNYFLMKKQAALKLEPILKSMETKKVIEPYLGGDGQTTYYKIVP